MNFKEFETACIALTRTAVGWQSKAAKILGVQVRTFQRWIKEGRDTGAMPQHAVDKLADVIGRADPSSVWPRDEWMHGHNADGSREYITHLQAPRFVARVVSEGPNGPHESDMPADTLSGQVYVMDGSDQEDQLVLCEVAWIDEPRPGEVVQLFEAASDFYEYAIAVRSEEG